MNNNSEKTVVTRFAPSPTGYLHIGSARTALFSYLYARQHGGKVLLRIEDTDKERSKEEFTKGITDGLSWLGLSFDGFSKQSERTEIYKKYLQKLIDEDKAYISKEEVKEEGQRSEVIRFRNPNKKVSFTDLIRGEIEFDTTELGNFVIAKSLEEPIFHLAVVVDDFESGITHVIRGEDHISNTPRQILIQEAIGAPRPTYAHLPLILSKEREKLSKRKHGEIVSVGHYMDRGFLSSAVINFVAMLGWNPGTEQEIFSLQELIAQFKIEKVQKSGAIFNTEKLDWLNKEHIKLLGPDYQYKAILEYIPKQYDLVTVRRIQNLIIDRIVSFGDIENIFETGELDFFFNTPVYPKEKLLWKDETDFAKTSERLTHAISLIQKISEPDFSTADNVKAALWNYATEQGRGFVLWPMRVALSGKDKSPDPFALASLLGKDETLNRLHAAVGLLNQ